MENANAPESQSDAWAQAGDQFIPEVEEVPPLNGEKAIGYLGELKTYFISGKKTGESLPPEVYPIRFGLQQRTGNLNTDYPVFFDSENDDLVSLYATLENLVEEHFAEAPATIIQRELPTLFARVQETIQEDANGIVAQPLIEAIMSAMQKLDLPQKDTAAFEATIDKIQQELLNQVNLLFDFSGKTAFQILNLQNELRGNSKSAFLTSLKKVITGLNELLVLHGGTSNQPTAHLDFAEDLMSFDKIKDLAASTASSQLPKPRLQRIRAALQTLTSAQESYAHSTMTIFASEAIIQSFDLERIFGNVNFKVASDNACHQAVIQSQKEIEAFVQTIAALRMGNLMIEQKYNEDLHDSYFDQFDLTFLTKDDLQYLHPIVVIEDVHELMLHSNDFLSLLSNNSFVKVLGLNLLDDLFDSKNQNESDALELASLAIFRRNNYVFQGGIDLPSDLKESYKKGLAFPGAVFWNILALSGETEQTPAKYFALKAAIESRYFPRIEYKADDHHFAGTQIKLQNNPAPDATFVTYEQKIKSPSGIETSVLDFTVADFLAMDSKLKETLEIIPPANQNPSLIPLPEYLSLSQDALSGKIPFIWLVDDQNKLRQAAIPVYWVQKCRTRLEYWRFLQSISGINNTHLQNTIEAVKAEWEKEKNTEIEALKATLQAQYEEERSGDLQVAVTRMLHGLLNSGNSIESVLTEISKEEFKPAVEVKEEQASPAAEPSKEEEEEEEPKATVNEAAWVESEECTSCKDCIDALPSVFKYNEDKQAYVHNPKGGTFAQIVKVAEKCPARCIHPGVPQNKKEASLEMWVKRAEKFN